MAAARAADLILVPTRTSIVELETLPQVSDLLRIAGSVRRSFVVLNALHPSAGSAGIEEAKQVLPEASLQQVLNLPVPLPDPAPLTLAERFAPGMRFSAMSSASCECSWMYLCAST